MTDRPIIFSAPMVRALLDGSKTQTRRVLKLGRRQPDYIGPRGCTDDPSCWGWNDDERGDYWLVKRGISDRGCLEWTDWRGAYASGDRLYVREAFLPGIGYPKPVAIPRYRADNDRPEWRGLWKPSIHMPRWASRLTLAVTDVRVQRLQDISEADAVAEGCPCRNEDDLAGMEATGWFRDLWNSLHGADAWGRNPWVVALTFTVQRGNIDKVTL